MSDLTSKKLLFSIENLTNMIGKKQTLEVKTKEDQNSKISFQIKSIIGRGTFGVVCKIQTQKRIKALKTVFQDNKYCNRELKILKIINHKNIVGLEYYFYTSKTVLGSYLNMIFEFVPTCLEDFIKNKNVDIDLIKNLYKQAISGLAYLHKYKICHRDIKPANILIDEFNVLKICDFGCAKILDDNVDNVAYICSRFYRAPENLFGITKYSCGIDIWAIGLVFCEFRLKGPLFFAKNTEEMIKIIFNKINDCIPNGIDCLYLENTNEQKFFKFIYSLFGDPFLSDVLFKSLIINPNKRISAKEILKIDSYINTI